jgi:hypothetical protein
MIDKIEKIKNQFSSSEVQEQQLKEISSSIQQNEESILNVLQIANKMPNNKNPVVEYDQLVKDYNAKLRQQIMNLLQGQQQLISRQELEKNNPKDTQTDEGFQDIERLEQESASYKKKFF